MLSRQLWQLQRVSKPKAFDSSPILPVASPFILYGLAILVDTPDAAPVAFKLLFLRRFYRRDPDSRDMLQIWRMDNTPPRAMSQSNGRPLNGRPRLLRHQAFARRKRVLPRSSADLAKSRFHSCQNRKRTPLVVARLLRLMSPLAIPPNATEYIVPIYQSHFGRNRQSSATEAASM
jgi:hypothetical protein